MVLFNRLGEVLDRFKEWGWEVHGSIDCKLRLENYPIDSALSAKLIITKLTGRDYSIQGELYSPNRRLMRINEVAEQEKLVKRLGDVIARRIESYFGETNMEPYKNSYEQNRVI